MATESRPEAEALESDPGVWIDAQLPPVLAGWLRDEYGVNAVHVKDLDLTRAPDCKFSRQRLDRA